MCLIGIITTPGTTARTSYVGLVGMRLQGGGNGAAVCMREVVVIVQT